MVIRTSKKSSILVFDNFAVEITEYFDGIGNYEHTETKLNGKPNAPRGSTLEAIRETLPPDIAAEIVKLLELEK